MLITLNINLIPIVKFQINRSSLNIIHIQWCFCTFTWQLLSSIFHGYITMVTGGEGMILINECTMISISAQILICHKITSTITGYIHTYIHQGDTWHTYIMIHITKPFSIITIIMQIRHI